MGIIKRFPRPKHSTPVFVVGPLGRGLSANMVSTAGTHKLGMDIIFEFPDRQEILPIQVSSQRVLEEGVLATARRVFPVREHYLVEPQLGNRSVIISRRAKPDKPGEPGWPAGLPEDAVVRYINDLPTELRKAVMRKPGQKT